MEGVEDIKDLRIKFLFGTKIFDKFKAVFDSCCGGISLSKGSNSNFLTQKGTFENPIKGAYANEAAAVTAGLKTGDLYQTTGAASSPLNVAGIVMVKQ